MFVRLSTSHQASKLGKCALRLSDTTSKTRPPSIYRVLQHQTKLMFYSGDTDGAITTFGSKSWMKNLGWDVLEAYRPWYTDGQVSGYTQLYDGLRFVSVKGVG